MEQYNGILTCTAEELQIPTNTFNSIVRRNPSIRVRRACKGTPALYSVDALPAKYKQMLLQQQQAMPEPKQVSIVDRVVLDSRAIIFYGNYQLEDGRHLDNDKQTLYCNSAAILRTFGTVIEEANALRMKQDGKKLNITEFWQKASKALPQIGLSYPHCLPNNPRELQRKYNAFCPDNYEALINGRFGLSNSNKVKTDEQKALLTLLLSHHNNFDNQRIANIYNQEAERQGWPTITANTVANYKTKESLTISASRLGETNFRNKREMTVQRSRPTSPFLFWSADGWDCELYYQAKVEGSKGNVTTYHNRLVLEVVLDCSCDYIMGYAIGYRENSDLIREALSNAVRHGAELAGDMLQVCQLQTDHFGTGKAMAPFIAAISDKFTPARVKNAKAKPVEAFFNYLNREYCQIQHNWSGFGITVDPDKQPNSEALNLAKKEFPDEEEVRRQIVAMVEADRAKKRGKLMEMLQGLKDENRHIISRENYLLHIGGKKSEFLYGIDKQGVRMTALGNRIQYDCFDLTFRDHSDIRWQLYYDIEDLQTVLAVSPDGQYRYMLEKKYIQPMALADRQEGDSQALKRVEDYNKALEQEVTDRLATAYDNAERVIGESNTLRNVLRRSVITDSKGRHKALKEADMNDRGENEYKQDDYSIF